MKWEITVPDTRASLRLSPRPNTTSLSAFDHSTTSSEDKSPAQRLNTPGAKEVHVPVICCLLAPRPAFWCIIGRHIHDQQPKDPCHSWVHNKHPDLNTHPSCPDSSPRLLPSGGIQKPQEVFAGAVACGFVPDNLLVEILQWGGSRINESTLTDATIVRENKGSGLLGPN